MQLSATLGAVKVAWLLKRSPTFVLPLAARPVPKTEAAAKAIAALATASRCEPRTLRRGASSCPIVRPPPLLGSGPTDAAATSCAAHLDLALHRIGSWIVPWRFSNFKSNLAEI